MAQKQFKNLNVTQKEFKNLTRNVGTSDFSLKTNASELKTKIDKFNEDDIKKLQELAKVFEGKNFIEYSD